MNILNTKRIQCPYCGELFDIVVDCSVQHQCYIEDCEVCCRPINMDVTISVDCNVHIVATHEDA